MSDLLIDDLRRNHYSTRRSVTIYSLAINEIEKLHAELRKSGEEIHALREQLSLAKFAAQVCWSSILDCERARLLRKAWPWLKEQEA